MAAMARDMGATLMGAENRLAKFKPSFTVS